MMRTRIATLAVVLLGLGVLPGLAQAQNREHLQLSAEVRILAEQLSRLQLSTNQLAEVVVALGKRLDAQSDANVKAFATEQSLVTQLSSNVSTIREKIDSNAVRVSTLAQEIPAIRDGISRQAELLNTIVGLLQPPAAPTADVAAPTVPSPLATVSVPASPGRYYQAAFNDYMGTADRLDNAIEGFQEVVEKFPTAPDAAHAQFYLGEAYYRKGNYKDAIQAYGKLIADYKGSDHVPDAYFQQGMCYQALGQRATAVKTFDTLIKQFPESTAADMAKQRIK